MLCALFVVKRGHLPERPLFNRSVSKHAGNLYLDMASDLGEEMDTEIEISGDIRNLLPRDGSVNAYGSHLAENEGEQNEDDGARRSESRETEVSCSCKTTCSRKKTARSEGCPCRNADSKCSSRCGCGKGKKQCKNGKMEAIERENAQNLPGSAFKRHNVDIQQSVEEIKKFITGLSVEQKDKLLIDLLSKGKGSLDYAKNSTEEDGDPGEPSHGEPDLRPDWCVCSHCIQMDNPQEQKCCRLRNCITSYELFQNLCLDRNVLEVAIKARCDMRADDIDFSSNSFRKAAYRQYILWRYGRLGKGNRRVCPSCCVRMIRSVYPSADGNYMGFRAL